MAFLWERPEANFLAGFSLFLRWQKISNPGLFSSIQTVHSKEISLNQTCGLCNKYVLIIIYCCKEASTRSASGAWLTSLGT